MKSTCVHNLLTNTGRFYCSYNYYYNYHFTISIERKRRARIVSTSVADSSVYLSETLTPCITHRSQINQSGVYTEGNRPSIWETTRLFFCTRPKKKLYKYSKWLTNNPLFPPLFGAHSHIATVHLPILEPTTLLSTGFDLECTVITSLCLAT